MTPHKINYPKNRKQAPLIDLTGRVYGRLTVVAYAGRIKPKRNKWLCRCECGTERTVEASNLKNGSTKSCGCLLRESIHRKRKPRLDMRLGFGVAARNLVILAYKTRARLAGYEWDLTLEQAEKLFQKNCRYCGCAPAHRSKAKYSNGEYIYNGIDRVDSSRGYAPGNVVTCCRTCNVAKNATTYEEFCAWIDRVHANLHGKRGSTV